MAFIFILNLCCTSIYNIWQAEKRKFSTSYGPNQEYRNLNNLLVQQILWFKAITYESKEQKNFDTSLELLL